MNLVDTVHVLPRTNDFSKTGECVLKTVVKSLMVSLVVFSSTVVHAGDPEAGKAKSAVCAACHGPNGISPTDIWPNLAGQKQGYLVKQLKDFRDGTRLEPTMAPFVKPLTDKDIENLAAYYSSMKPGQ